MEVFCRDISERLTFNRRGYNYKNIYLNNEKHTGIWEVSLKGSFQGYEIIKGIKAKNPDGRIVYTYPSDERFGRPNGLYVIGRTQEEAKTKAFDRLKEFESEDNA